MLILIPLSDNMSKRHHSRCNEQSILNRTLISISQARKKIVNQWYPLHWNSSEKEIVKFDSFI